MINNVNNFNNLFSLTSLKCGRPILVSNASNINAGLVITGLTGGRGAVNVSYITVYIGSVTTRKTRPLFFLSCVTYNGGSPTLLRRIITNITSNYIRTNSTLINNRATRVPNVCSRSRCSLTKFSINITRGSTVISNSAVIRNSILVNLPSANIRSGNFSLIHGTLFRRTNCAISAGVSRLNNRGLNSILLAPAGVCIGTLSPLFGTNIIGNITRVANNNFVRGVPHVVPSNLTTRVRLNA